VSVKGRGQGTLTEAADNAFVGIRLVFVLLITSLSNNVSRVTDVGMYLRLLNEFSASAVKRRADMGTLRP